MGGLGIWVLVDKPSFLNLFDEAQKVSGISDEFNISIYTSAAYILLVVSFLVVLISFFGCCGAWKEVQKELKCCGVDNVKDWAGDEFQWSPSDANKPIGCCYEKQDGTAMDEEQQNTCRRAVQDPDSSDYYFRGCYTMMKTEIESNQNTVVGVAVGVVIVMFLNMLFSFAMCTMVR